MTRRLTSRTPITRVYREEINPDIAATTDASTKAQRVSLANSRIVVSERVDSLAVEEPLQIRVDGTDFLTTMRTPGNDFELVHGLLHAEGIIRRASDIATIRYCGGAVGNDGLNTYNTLDVALTPAKTEDSNQDFATVTAGKSDSQPFSLPVRSVLTTSACGICGTTSIDDVEKRSSYPIHPVRPTAEFVLSLPAALEAGQKAFRRTGGIHAAGAVSSDGQLILAREDVGRHNAADKVIGAMLMHGDLPAKQMYLVMTSRASFELVQKAVLAGFSGLVTVSAATSLAVDLARQSGLFLSGFTRENRFNLYNGFLEDTP
ncbi:formate dehydrogenase accessory sulfurtransferase FdhD [Corynebacterium pseudodiphtheriticum]|uniref:formate dehydrogenase accessory sulfurtransferase FdhD n=1 Tax=Corynebacterium pseudodiphtheriticum TaxID=37637 RepID=UPI0025436D74|nr:formate dehydrogenase accessory sulfurtransferase FdhD [Corynebacterium pseudodiphtheriticum]MDK4249009.1 formate dehydrogenase accessory sulfurtransferase FdhD [Corynebacterium pseudodiphtheriticum]MDK4287266.1 formate dehydrogenase accessory sulfurtransferase FdhD [Corynebacterium pseudodiphtheriticum]